MNDGTVRLRETKQRNHKWLYRIQYQSGQQCFDYQSYRNRAFQTAKRFGLEINEPVSTTIDKNGTLELLTKYFQRGIHSQLDLFTEINLHTFDSLFTRTLAMRGIIYLPHRIEIVNLRQDSTVVQGLSSPQKYRPGKEAVSYYYNYDLYNKWHTGYGWNRQIPSSCNK